ncbi:GGDEF domain-containing response regulator [Pseudoalteromonas sp. T1lg65]|uniref:GGDEF domain-containing response regulator n=1 Tax=Pseudoalteromonas sp. T1lg65 TaxID=2077101 RepID=UPI003F7A5D1B
MRESKPVILIVDKDPLNCMVLKNALSEQYQVIEKVGCEQCFDTLRTIQVDLIIMDTQIDHGNGFQLLEALKKDQKTYNIPVIIISSSVSFSDEARCLHLGAADYITKPFNPMIVTARLKNQLLIKQKNDLLESLVNIDGLTELPNRLRLEQLIASELDSISGLQKSLSVMLIELDYFKEFNEHYGYTQGDECLIKVAKQLKSSADEYSAVVGRFDGTRFAIVVCSLTVEQLEKFAWRVHDAINELQISHMASPICAHVSVSIGAVRLKAQASYTAKRIIGMADEALSHAHQQQQAVVLV